MSIQNPYFNLHQLTLGQYTSGNEFVLATGEIYTGPYYITPTGQRFTGFRPENDSKELFEIRVNPTMDILTYNKLGGRVGSRYVTPVPYSPSPTMDDYKLGKIDRFFIQKRNSSSDTIMEIDADQYNSVNVKNNPGINGVIYNSLTIVWVISRLPAVDAAYINELTIRKSLSSFPNLNRVLTDTLQFYK